MLWFEIGVCFLALLSACDSTNYREEPVSGLSRKDLGSQVSFGDSFFGGPEEEHLKKELVLGSELGRTLEELDGVISARVHLSLADTSILSQGRTQNSEAAILIRHNGAFRQNKQAIQNFVSNAISGLEPERVAVLFSMSEEEQKEAIQRVGPIQVAQSSVFTAKLCIGGLLTICLVLALVLIAVGVTLRRIKRQ